MKTKQLKSLANGTILGIVGLTLFSCVKPGKTTETIPIQSIASLAPDSLAGKRVAFMDADNSVPCIIMHFTTPTSGNIMEEDETEVAEHVTYTKTGPSTAKISWQGIDGSMIVNMNFSTSASGAALCPMGNLIFSIR